jgi:tripartite-type tricarboxylate transporter receptor subunit TctC
LLVPVLAIALIALVQSFPALAQAWPSKPIRLVVPYPPGGSADLLARTAPDGYTILLGTGATHGLTLLLSKAIPYDPVKDAIETFRRIVNAAGIKPE